MAENISLRNYLTFSINYFACSNNYLKCVKIKIIFSNTVFLNQTNSLRVLLLRLTWCRNNKMYKSYAPYRTTKKTKTRVQIFCCMHFLHRRVLIFFLFHF